MLFKNEDCEELEEREKLFREMIGSNAFPFIESRRVSEGNFR